MDMHCLIVKYINKIKKNPEVLSNRMDGWIYGLMYVWLRGWMDGYVGYVDGYMNE